MSSTFLFFSRNQTFRFDESDLLNTVGLSGEDWLDLNALITQAKDLVKLFIGKKHALKKFDQFALNASCFCWELPNLCNFTKILVQK